ncbi:MAG: hypothetical protein RLZZ401_1783 [Pseudomonadota bacterium]|jgi:acyl-CoA synthetase (AMP-forming)/AMP-acid ligase II
MNPQDIDFAQITEVIHHHALATPSGLALIEGGTQLTYGELDQLMDRVAAGLQRDGLRAGDAVCLCAASTWTYAVVFLGALRAGVVVAPLAPSATPESLARMAVDAQARLLFTDGSVADRVGQIALAGAQRISLDGSGTGLPWLDWLTPAGAQPTPVTLEPAHPFNIIYSSGTTGEPKGIVQSHGMRWGYAKRAWMYDYSPRTVTLLSTPLYSNTTLVVFFPSLVGGACVLLMPKFDAVAYLELAQRHRVTHAMLVPVQYQRLLAVPGFERYDLSAFKHKFATSAPFAAALKAQVLQRWPGSLVEFYGMTEGGGSCILAADQHPDKLHTVGQPAAGHDIRLIDEAGVEVAAGEVGEVVGRSPVMMNGYHGQPDKTREAEWYSPEGLRYIRTGDVGRFDAEGFLTLMDRRKDMVITGGFNVYPSDLEAVLCEHAGVQEAAVVGVPSEQWGETPVGFVVARPGTALDVPALLAWANARLGKTQRLSALHAVDELPRSAIGKVLKRALRDRLGVMQ